YALLNGRNYVIPDDIKIMAYPALGHRIIIKPEYRDVVKPMDIINESLSRVPVPR
ncbi:MAG: MoxR family ATPase, partial [Vulcanisaeta sp.]|nr:MoxR family ATPase [Vulcanisaeta sp.]